MERIENGSAYLVAGDQIEGTVVVSQTPERSIRLKNIELTNRDLDIFEYILNMKFARANDVFTKFFKVTRASQEARSNAWAKKRLLQLEQGRYLRSTYSHLNRERYFVTTLKACHALSVAYPSRQFAKPGRGFEHRTLAHDRLVLEFRTLLECQYGDINWISDRQLRSHMGDQFGLDARYVPDGIFTLPQGEPAAFELEIAQKSRRRYRDKIQNYVALIRDRRAHSAMFRKVNFFCTKEVVADALRDESRIYGEAVQVHVMRSTAPGFGGVL